MALSDWRDPFDDETHRSHVALLGLFDNGADDLFRVILH